MPSMLSRAQKEEEKRLFERIKSVMAEIGISAGYQEYADKLNERGIKNIWGKTWNAGLVSTTLRRHGIRRKGSYNHADPSAATVLIEKKEDENKFKVTVTDCLIQCLEILGMENMTDHQKFSMVKMAINNPDLHF